MVSADPGVPGGENKCGWAGYHKSPYHAFPQRSGGEHCAPKRRGLRVRTLRLHTHRVIRGVLAGGGLSLLPFLGPQITSWPLLAVQSFANGHHST